MPMPRVSCKCSEICSCGYLSRTAPTTRLIDNGVAQAIEQSVLVGMPAARNRLRHPPDHHFQDCAVVEIEPLALWEIRFHTLAIMPTTTIVVNCANETPWPA